MEHFGNSDFQTGHEAKLERFRKLQRESLDLNEDGSRNWQRVYLPAEMKTSPDLLLLTEAFEMCAAGRWEQYQANLSQSDEKLTVPYDPAPPKRSRRKDLARSLSLGNLVQVVRTNMVLPVMRAGSTAMKPHPQRPQSLDVGNQQGGAPSLKEVQGLSALPKYIQHEKNKAKAHGTKVVNGQMPARSGPPETGSLSRKRNSQDDKPSGRRLTGGMFGPSVHRELRRNKGAGSEIKIPTTNSLKKRKDESNKRNQTSHPTLPEAYHASARLSFAVPPPSKSSNAAFLPSRPLSTNLGPAPSLPMQPQSTQPYLVPSPAGPSSTTQQPPALPCARPAAAGPSNTLLQASGPLSFPTLHGDGAGNQAECQPQTEGNHAANPLFAHGLGSSSSGSLGRGTVNVPRFVSDRSRVQQKATLAGGSSQVQSVSPNRMGTRTELLLTPSPSAKRPASSMPENFWT